MSKSKVKDFEIKYKEYYNVGDIIVFKEGVWEEHTPF